MRKTVSKTLKDYKKIVALSYPGQHFAQLVLQGFNDYCRVHPTDNEEDVFEFFKENTNRNEEYDSKSGTFVVKNTSLYNDLSHTYLTAARKYFSAERMSKTLLLGDNIVQETRADFLEAKRKLISAFPNTYKWCSVIQKNGGLTR